MGVPVRLLVLFVLVFIASMGLTATAQDSAECGTLTNISEILWQADEATRLSFGEVKTLFPNLVDPTDDQISVAISSANQANLPDIIINTQPSSNGNLFQRVRMASGYNDLNSFYNYYSPVALKSETFYFETETWMYQFLSNINSHQAMKELKKYLECKGFLSQTIMNNLLFGIWLHTLPRYPEFGQFYADSSGFEYVFVGEYGVDARFVSGLHDWYRLYRLQQSGEVTFPGSVEVIEPNILALTFTWEGRCQPKGSLFLGSSAAFQMAIYTLCFLEMPGQDCTVSLGGHPVTLKTERIEYSNAPIGNLKSAYPIVTVSQPCDACAMPPRDCGSLTDIAEKLWDLDATSRLTFGDAMTLFPDLTEWTDSSIAQAISQADPGSLPDIVLNYQNFNDSKFFQFVNTTKLNSEVYDAFRALVTAYVPEIITAEYDDYYYFEMEGNSPAGVDSPASYQEIASFVNAIFRQKSMEVLADYLQCRGFFKTGSVAKDKLRQVFQRLWFEDFKPQSGGRTISNAFWNTFAGQFGNRLRAYGPYNWYRLYMLEASGDMKDIRLLAESDPNAMRVNFTWQRYSVVGNSVWMGSSPEFEMAIYTLCDFESNFGRGYCRFSLGGQQVQARVSRIMSYSDYFLENAYPEIVEPTTTASPASGQTTLTPSTNLCPATTTKPSTTSSTTATTTSSTTTTIPPTTTSSTTTATSPTTTSSTTTTTTTTPSTTSSTTTTTSPTTTSSTTTTTSPTTTSSTTTATSPTTTSSITTTTTPSTTSSTTTATTPTTTSSTTTTTSTAVSDASDRFGENKGSGLHVSLTKIKVLPLILLTNLALKTLFI